MERQGQSVRGVDVDDIEARLLCADGRVAMPLADLSQIVLRCRAGLTWLVARTTRNTHRAWSERDRPRVQVGGVVAVVGQLDACEGTVLVDRVRDQGVGGDVGVVPQAAFEERREVSGVMDLHLLGADHTPASFRFDAAHGGMSTRHAVAEAVAMWYLVEAVRRGDGSDTDGLEEEGEGGGHDGKPLEYNF